MTPSRQRYIEQYADYAMAQMRRYGIPASITLAQGIIESADGKSTLANTANNHFGVKGTYNGNYVLADDDRPNEKFKKYDNVGQSYEDHSKVLMAQRYQKYVGQLSPDDYRGWAAGIQKGGYATAKSYVNTIVGVIEGANLQKYDQMVMEQMRREGRQFGTATNPLSATTSASTGNGQGAVQTGSYSMPVKRNEFMLITSPYGEREDPVNKGQKQIHHGIDIKTNKESVLATENGGVVVGVDHRTTTAGGKTITVEYAREDGTKTRVQYMHLSEITVKKGDKVTAGQKLGVSGNTGTRTTGEHLHFGVINVAKDGKQQWVNPAAYLAEIAQKGGIKIEAQYNGKNLLAGYMTAGTRAVNTDEQQVQTPENWMNRLLCSDDAALGLTDGMGTGSGEGLLGSLMQMFMMMLMLSIQMENKSKEEKLQTVSDALVNKRIDISSFVPNMKSAVLTVSEQGNAILSINDGKKDYTHTLTNAEQENLSNVLHSDSDENTKRQRIGTIVNAITFSLQAANNYEEIETQRAEQSRSLTPGPSPIGRGVK